MTGRRPALATSLLVAAAVSPAAARAHDLVSRPQSVVYGSDDRVEVAAHPDPAVRALASRSVVSLVARPAIVPGSSTLGLFDGPYSARIGANDGARDTGLCDDERFANEPAPAYCSGILIAPNVVLTAGHCIDDALCPAIDVVFGFFAREDGSGIPIPAANLFSCRSVIARGDESSPDSGDFAIFTLDRPVAEPLGPAGIAGTGGLAVGTPLLMIGSPLGLPQKVDDGGRVRSTEGYEPGAFTATTDSFAGNSGSGVFVQRDGVRGLAGILVAGEADLETDGTCERVRVCPENDASVCDGEAVLRIEVPLAAFCDKAGDPALCGNQARCGDDVCAAGESCPADCAPVDAAGDGLCGVTERASGADCRIPAAWTCDPAAYGTLDACDCACGAPDPDCGLASDVINGCFSLSEICTDEGLCADPEAGGGGGGCSTAPAAVNPWWLVALPSLLALRRRRQR